MMMNKILLTAVMIMFASGWLGAQVSLDGPAILKKVDELSNFKNVDFTCTATIVTNKPGKDPSTNTIKFFRRDKDDKFLVLIEKPDVQKGQGYLKIDDNVWFYDPNTREFSHSSLKENFSDSNARNEDFGASNLVEDYAIVEMTDEKIGKTDVVKLVLKAKTDLVPTPHKKIWVQKGSVPLVLKEEDYSLSKRLMRTNMYKDYEIIDGRYVPKTQLFINNLNEGERSQLNLKDISIGAIPDRVFQKNYVESVSGR